MLIVGWIWCSVNAVCPGPILTDATKKHAALQGISIEAAVEKMTGHMIIPRYVLKL